MRVDQQGAIEGAPSLILSDGDGGVTYHLVTDEALTEAAKRVCEANGWNDEERNGLYQALVNAIELIKGAAALTPGDTQ